MTGLLSPAHIAILMLVLLLVFGAKRLPELGRSLGSGLREFKHTLDGEHDAAPPTLAPAPDPIAHASAAAETVTVEPPAARPAA
jgi:sec-independent protein translocase protein TatA